jgi:hypothetical protein
LKHGKIVRISEFAGEQRNNQNGFFPFGMEPELGSKVLPILFKDMECGNLSTILRKISNALTSSPILSGLRANENPIND